MINIKIKKSNKTRRKYASIALTVDRDEFLDEIAKLRKKYNIDHSLVCPHFESNKKYSESLLSSPVLNNTEILRLWFAEFFNILPIIIKDDWIYKPDTDIQLQKNVDLSNKLRQLIYRNDDRRNMSQNFQKDIISIRKRLNLTPRMDRVIEHATLCNLVNNEDLLLAHGSVELEDGISDLSLFKCFNMQIALEATVTDVIDAYKKDILPLQIQSWGIDTTLRINTLTSIRKDRKRYWKNKKGFGHVYLTADETVGINKYKSAKRNIRLLKDFKDRTSREDAEKIIAKVENSTAGIKKSLQRYKGLLNNTVKNILK